ncbi:MAG: PilZ domain-containing protein [Pirellulales bacterium]|nr:PilZ domain-containing protein [Pirellulales bacterium]
MLQDDDPLEELIRTFGPLRCEVDLPDSWSESPLEGKMLLGSSFDQRRFPRFQIRVCGALRYRQSLPALPRAEAWHRVFARDISRCGLAFLHSEQLFPREQMRLVLPDGKESLIEVARCRQIQPRCFEVGVRFVERFRGSAEDRQPEGYSPV